MEQSILVVENDPFIRSVLCKRLARDGYEVQEAQNGVSAMDALQNGFQPDLVISNWEMPEMDGQELCRRLKEQEKLRSVYFILLTSRDLEEDVVSALESGADEYIVKPVDIKVLMARVSAGLRLVRLQRDLENSNAHLNSALERIDHELEVVAEIQRSLLPLTLPEIEGLNFGAFYRPSDQSGGDYYDVLTLKDGRLGIAIADVSGHGTPAMVAMALTRSLFHIYGPACRDPAELLATINRKLFHHLPTDQYVTMFYGILEADFRRLAYSSAGQTPPLWQQASAGEAKPLQGCEGFPLKLVAPEVDYANRQLEVDSGDMLLLYTDGVNENMNGSLEQFGIERIAESLNRHRGCSAPQLVDKLVIELDDFADGHPQADDITMLAVEFH